jgi:dUTP pyrophosphatase
MKLKFKKLHEQAVLPTHSNHGDAGLDLTVTKIFIDGQQDTHHYGVSVEIPEGNVGLLFQRSSVRKYDVRLSNAVGVLDSSYRGEIKAVFDVHHFPGERYKVGDRTAQLVIVPFVSCVTEWSESLTETDRGTGSYGSTGA